MNRRIITEFFDQVLKLINYINCQTAEIEKNRRFIDNNINYKLSRDFDESLKLLNDKNQLLRKKLSQLAHLLASEDEELMNQLDEIYLHQQKDPPV